MPARSSKSVELTDAVGIAVAERLGQRLTHPEREVYPEQGVSKAEIVAYYDAVGPRMLPHIVGRPLSLVRQPPGSSHPFFQKHESAGFPDAFHRTPIAEKEGEVENYLYVEDLAGLVAGVQMNVLEIHIWGSHVATLEKPDRLVFDIDPDEGLAFAEVRRAALDIRDKLQKLGLRAFPMVTGGKGIHVVVPIKPAREWPEIKLFCKTFAQQLEATEPQRFTAALSKARREGRMFIDYLRNERGSTAVAPFSTRARPGAPCAVPVSWDEVEKLAGANVFSLGAAAARAQGPVPWPNYFKLTQSITKAMLSSVAVDRL